MWRSWGNNKSTSKIHDTSATPSSPSSPFSFYSFKDIIHLVAEDPSPPSPHRPIISKSFNRVRLATSILRSSSLSLSLSKSKLVADSTNSTNSVALQIVLPGTDKHIVLYYTSLRVVRSTFEDCKAVRSILRGFRVSIDERDLSIDPSFLHELQQIFGHWQTKKLNLPRVFIRGRYVGGAEEIRQMHESGELKKLVEGLPSAEPGVCEACGAHRFVLCQECNGSHKLYIEKSGFRSCTACNENGLVRCPSCSFVSI